MLKNDNVLGQLQPGRAFGELAILYGCTRTASIKGQFVLYLYVFLLNYRCPVVDLYSLVRFSQQLSCFTVYS